MVDQVDASSRTFRVIGRRTPKVDGTEKVTGRAQFGADIYLPRMLVGKVLRSPFAHARIKKIDTSRAASLPGVRAVITGRDLPALKPGTSSAYGDVTSQVYYLSSEVL